MLKELYVVLSDIQYATGMELLRENLLKQEMTSCFYIGQLQNKLFMETCQKRKLSEDSLVVTDEIAVYGCLCTQNYENLIVMIHKENRSCHFEKARYAVESLENLDYDFFKKVFLRFRGLPWEIGRTKRCILREMTVQDVDALYELYADPEITAYMEGLYEDREEEIAYIKDYVEKIYAFYGMGTWLIIQKETGIVIGRAGFNWRPGYEEPELGFMIAKPYQEKGYAKEVCNEILQIGIKEYGFEAVQALVRVGNTISEHLCEKLSFVFQEEVLEEGIVHRRYLWTYSESEHESAFEI